MEIPMGSTVGMENDESGMTLVGMLETPAALPVTTSTMSCTVMELSQTIDDILQIHVEEEEVSPDSDDSEIKTRRLRKNKGIADPLKQLIKPEFEELLDYLEYEIPNSLHILSFIKVLLKWKDTNELKQRGIKYKILVNREECGHNYSVVIAYFTWKGEVKGSIYAPSHSGEQIFKEAVRYSKYFPIEGAGCEWSIYPVKVASEFLAYWKLKHDDGGIGPRYTAYPVHLYWIPKDDVDSVNFETPRDIKVYELEEKHVRTVNYYWGRHYEGSEDLVSKIIQTNISAGAFTYTGCLVGWAYQTHYGAIAIPFTLPKYRKKGVGRSVLLSLAQLLAKENFDPHIFIYKDDQSLKVFLKNSGFKYVNEMHYFYIDPPMVNPIFSPPPHSVLSSDKSLIKKTR